MTVGTVVFRFQTTGTAKRQKTKTKWPEKASQEDHNDPGDHVGMPTDSSLHLDLAIGTDNGCRTSTDSVGRYMLARDGTTTCTGGMNNNSNMMMNRVHCCGRGRVGHLRLWCWCGKNDGYYLYIIVRGVVVGIQRRRTRISVHHILHYDHGNCFCHWVIIFKYNRTRILHIFWLGNDG
jgi:hypothetical protein